MTKIPDDISVGRYVKRQLSLRRITIKEAAEHLNISRVNLSLNLNGTYNISMNLAFELEKYLGIDPEVLLSKQLKDQIKLERERRAKETK